MVAKKDIMITKSIPKIKTFDLKKIINDEKQEELMLEFGWLDKLQDMRDFIVNGQTNAFYGNVPLVYGYFKTECMYVEKGVIYQLNGDFCDDFNGVKEICIAIDNGDGQIVGVLLPGKAKQKYFCLANGDEESMADTNTLVCQLSQKDTKVEYSTISFNCLTRFFGGEMARVAYRLAKQEIVLVDYSPDSKIPLTKAELKQVCSFKSKSKPTKLKPPENGYTLVGEEWHRSATVLLYAKKERMTILLGQDEGTYFGCELADNPKSIEAAYTSLTPKEARGVAGVKRQGEWFAVPVDVKDVPTTPNCIAETDKIILNRDSDESACHTVDTDSHLILVGKDGYVYAYNASLVHQHGGHADLDTKGWVKYCRNTARRSFSEEGVD